MKNKKSFIILIMVLFLTTGCVRTKMNMTIHKDKRMDLSMDMGVSKAFMEAYEQQEGITSGNSLEIFDISDEELASMKKKGIDVEEYDDGSYTGMKASLKIANIDTVSTTEDIDGDLESLLGATDSFLEEKQEVENKFIFTVKKGFFKNTYTAKLNSSMSDEVGDMTDLYMDTDATPNNKNNNTTGNGANNIAGGNSSMDDFDFSTLASGMDMTFTVHLPYKAISNNAKTVENDGKTLSWNLLEKGNINFTFSLYNMKNIYLLGGGIALFVLILIIVLVLFIKKRGNKNLSEDKTSIDRGMKESYPAVTNMIGPNLTSTNPPVQNTRMQTVPVTTKPVLQPNPIAPIPQPIQSTVQPVGNGTNLAMQAQNGSPTTAQPVPPQMRVVSNVNQQPVQTGNIQGQMNYKQNMVVTPTMNQQVANGVQPMPMPTPQPVNQVPTMTQNRTGIQGTYPSNQTMISNGQPMQVPTNNQIGNSPLQENATPMGQAQAPTNANPTDIFGQKNPF